MRKTKEEKTSELISKMQEEQERYRVWLMGQPPENILSSAAEWSAREDILANPEPLEAAGETVLDALLSAENPLQVLFGWMKEENEDEIRKQIDEMAGSIVKMMAPGY